MGLNELRRELRLRSDTIWRAEALEFVSRRALSRLVREEQWVTAYKGLYVARRGPLTFEETLRATLRWLGDGPIASHRLAGWLHRLDGCEARWLEFCERRERRGAVAPGLVMHRVRDLPPHELTVRQGIRCTNLVRTVIDLTATDISRRDLVMAYEDMYRRSRANRGRMLQRIAELQDGRDGMDVLVELAMRRGGNAPATDSAAEALCDDILWRAGLHAVRQHELFDGHGELLGRIDLAFPELRLAVEVDGFETHGKKPAAFYRDRLRDLSMSGIGWHVTRVTWPQLQDERQLSADLWRVVLERRRLLRSPWRPFGPPLREQLPLPL